MKKMLLPLVMFLSIVFFFTSSFLNAQDTTSAAKTLGGADRCWGMNFMWKKDFTVGKQKIDSYSIYSGENTRTDNWVTGFGLDWYLSNKASLNLIGSIGTDNENSANEGYTSDYSSTELGIKLGLNYYPLEMNKSVYWSIGPWISYISYDEEQTYTITEGIEDKYKYSTSNFGLGINASAYLKPWEDLNWEFYAGYNLGVFLTPASSIRTTMAGQTTTVKGPDITRFLDCGGMVGTRLYFDAR